MLRSVELRDYMLKKPIKVRVDDDIFTAISLIIDNKVSGVCVVDDKDTLLGILSEMDCLRAVLSATYNDSVSAGKVGDCMISQVVCCNLRADIVDVADDMLKKGHRRRPVVDNGKLVGQITCRQLLRVVSQFNNVP